jgi:predicted O-methyltransferase YrrM
LAGEVGVTRATIGLPDALHEYLLSVSLRESPVARRLREATALRENARMQIAPEQGQFMALLVRAIGARRTLDIGVFTGYSGLVVAEALPLDGRVVACEVDPGYAREASGWWEEGGVAGKMDLRLGPAVGTLDGLLEAGEAGAFDFAFIDADKASYRDYWERCLRLVRRGGLVAVDNVLAGGRVADPDNHEPYTEAIRAFNLTGRDDERVDLTLVPIADGLTLARVR